MDLAELRAACLTCRSCPLCQTRTNTVFGVGDEGSDILFVGEAPGQQEDATGVPFVGAAGQLLDRMLSIIGLGRHNCYIANIIKCRPPNNRDPLLTEQDACARWLTAQMDFLKPKIVVCLGRISAMRLIREDFRITREHGIWTEKNGVFYTALYHPSALLRDVSKRPETFYDLKKLQRKIREVCPGFYGENRQI